MNSILPSILTSRFFDLESKLKLFASKGVGMIHLDVMDAHFVPNLSFGPSMIKDIKTVFPFLIDAHLMVDNPLRVVPWFIQAGADWLSIHIETNDNIDECLKMMKNADVRCGLVLNPDTNIEIVFPYLKQLDYCLLMSVFPGYGGQVFIPETISKIAILKKEIMRQNTSCLIQVDGGINKQNLHNILEAGADCVVVGSALYNAANFDNYLSELKAIFGENE